MAKSQTIYFDFRLMFKKNPSWINFWSEKNDIIYLRINKRRNIKASNGKIGDWHEEKSKNVRIGFHSDSLEYFFKFWLSKLLKICSPKNKLTDWCHVLMGNDFIHSLEDETKKQIPSEIEPPLLCLAYVVQNVLECPLFMLFIP